MTRFYKIFTLEKYYRRAKDKTNEKKGQHNILFFINKKKKGKRENKCHGKNFSRRTIIIILYSSERL